VEEHPLAGVLLLRAGLSTQRRHAGSHRGGVRMKLAEVKPLVDELCNGIASAGGVVDMNEVRTALEAAFVAGVRSGLKYTSNAKFAEVFGGKKSDK
jgi:hypothetical protein